MNAAILASPLTKDIYFQPFSLSSGRQIEERVIDFEGNKFRIIEVPNDVHHMRLQEEYMIPTIEENVLDAIYQKKNINNSSISLVIYCL
jgi:hypothetical protein